MHSFGKGVIRFLGSILNLRMMQQYILGINTHAVFKLHIIHKL